MKTRYLIVILIAGIIVTVMSAIGFFSGPRRGDTAPQFVLHDLSGREVALQGERGNIVVLNFWATWCGTCISEVPVIEKIYREFREKHVSVITVLVDDDGGMLETLKKRMELTYPVYPDPDGLVADSYQVWGVPETFIIDDGGMILDRFRSAVDYKTLSTRLEEHLSKR